MSMAGNLRYAARNQQSVEIGGGIFTPAELAEAAKQIDSAEKLLAHLEKAVKSLEWAATVIGDMPPKCEYLESLAEAKALIARVKP